ncbi:serine/threonine protein kinase, partial [Myxococcota bacterium]|nr:serine/threonine protein kinase [Myxococcota bacterium]
MEATVDATDPLVGTDLAGKLRIEALRGEGAMGRVYRAHHLGLDKAVAVKVLTTTAALRGAQALERFRREARAASRVDHPNIVRVLDLDQDDASGVWYLVMELVDGEDLGQLLEREGPLAPKRAIAIVCDVLDALGAAHAAGVIHRDVKPRNILRLAASPPGRDRIKVCDFGLAKALDPDADGRSAEELTRAGTFCGTPAYMAPEQILGGPVDARTDVYAAGALLYKLLTGRTPFREKERSTLFASILNEPVPALVPTNAEPDPELDRIVRRALAKEPEHRYPTAEGMRDALRTRETGGSAREVNARVEDAREEHAREEHAREEQAREEHAREVVAPRARAATLDRRPTGAEVRAQLRAAKDSARRAAWAVGLTLAVLIVAIVAPRALRDPSAPREVSPDLGAATNVEVPPSERAGDGDRLRAQHVEARGAPHDEAPARDQRPARDGPLALD